MPDYEGRIIANLEGGRAEVLLLPDKSNIPGAADLNVCHCATPNSSLRIIALNPVGAKVGDIVSVRVEARHLAGNLFKLLGGAALGCAIGLVISVLWGSGIDTWPFTAAGLLSGGAAGYALIAKRGNGKEPFLERIVLSYDEAQGLMDGHEGCGTCGGCSPSR